MKRLFCRRRTAACRHKARALNRGMGMDGRRAGFGIPHVSPYLGGFGSFPMPLQQWTIGRTEKRRDEIG
ncbi:hypothetical protein [Ruminococcus callidus]|uniref:hypothetical protein n=1 Tax=Ruminococcus callidus TaxID=40519 RepID=UPI0026ED50DE|nr:hypothetical protein [Ruminococcus callidus]MBS4830716.1 hypothetical protein [Ruminococcus callidus]